MRKIQNKWVNGAIPALLIHCSIGTVYCWSLVSEPIASYVGAPKSTIEWAFSIAIFMLGMSAAFLGGLVENNVHRSSLVAAISFAIGMAGTGFFIAQKSVMGIFLSYGLVMGIGLGTGYLSPVKTLMIWFKDQKGLATGIAVAGFGLAKVIASPLMEYLKIKYGIVNMFYILAIIYFFTMFLGYLMLCKPFDWKEEKQKSTNFFAVFKIFKNKVFVGIWLIFFINITNGLSLISQEKSIIMALSLVAYTSTISSLTAVFNAGGRLFYSAWADRLKSRRTVYNVIFILAILFTAACIFTNAIPKSIAYTVLPLLFVVNAGYGGGFSNVPNLLAENFGMKTISQIHGVVLTAWAFAGIAGNQMASFIINNFGKFIDDGHGNMINPQGYQIVLVVTLFLYGVAFIISNTMVKGKKEELN